MQRFVGSTAGVVYMQNKLCLKNANYLLAEAHLLVIITKLIVSTDCAIYIKSVKYPNGNRVPTPEYKAMLNYHICLNVIYF